MDSLEGYLTPWKIFTVKHFWVKHMGEVSALIKENVGVIQGGNCSPMSFRKYLADLNN